MSVSTVTEPAVSRAPWTPAEFESRLRAKAGRYHIHHPFQVLMDNGQLNREQVQGWVINRFYYQLSIPRKDAALLHNCPDREVRQRWIQRIIDHDGRAPGEGGIEAWIHLAEACGVERGQLLSQEGVLPGVRFAVDAYVNFVRDANWLEGVASSLTELFAPTIHRARLNSWPQHYPWIDPRGLQYFRTRLTEAHRDVDHGLAIVLERLDSRALQERALEILQFKLDVLWSMLDAMHMAYVLNMPPYFNEQTVST